LNTCTCAKIISLVFIALSQRSAPRRGVQNVPHSTWVKTEVAFAVLLAASVFIHSLWGTFCSCTSLCNEKIQCFTILVIEKHWMQTIQYQIGAFFEMTKKEHLTANRFIANMNTFTHDFSWQQIARRGGGGGGTGAYVYVGGGLHPPPPKRSEVSDPPSKIEFFFA
jgi:hypothetical protein